MDFVQRDVKQVLLLRTSVLTNRLSPNDGGKSLPLTAHSDDCHTSSPSAAAVVVAVESLVTHLIEALSEGLWAGLDLWSCLQSLERVQGLPDPQEVQSYRFGSQIIFLIKSTYPTLSEAIKTRAFFRCVLNQGCLLAALELLGRKFRMVLDSYMMEHALLMQVEGRSLSWDKFVAAVAPIAGPPLDAFVDQPRRSAGASSRPGQDHDAGAVRFDLDLVVPPLDMHAKYMTEVKMYLAGLRKEIEAPTLPIVIDEVVVVATADEPSSSPPPEEQPQRQDSCNETVPTRQESGEEIAPTTTTAEEHVDPESPTHRIVKRIVKKVVVIKKIVKRSKATAQSSSSELDRSQSVIVDDDETQTKPDECDTTDGNTQHSPLTSEGKHEPLVAAVGNNQPDDQKASREEAELDKMLDELEAMIQSRRAFLTQRIHEVREEVASLQR